MKKQKYINWEVINQKEYRIKITTYTEKLNDQQKELFKKILNGIKNAGGTDETVLHILLEETDEGEHREQKLQLLLEYLNKNIKLEQTVSELEFYKKKVQNAEEKSRLLKKEIMGLKVKKCELEEILAECQKRLSLAEQENRNYAEQKEILLQIQKTVELIATRSEEIKEWPEHFGFIQRKEQQPDDITNVPVIEADKKEIDKNVSIIEVDEKGIVGSVPVTEDITIEIEEKKRETAPEEKAEENTAEYIEDMDEAFYEEFQGIALENAIDPEEYGTFMEAAPGEIVYYPLEEEDEIEEEFEEAGKNQRVNFFNTLLEKMDLNRFQKLKSSEQLSKLFELMEDKQISREEKKVFMRVIQESEKEDYVKIYQYIKEGREKELLKEEWNG